MRGKLVRPSISRGTRSFQGASASSVACAERERFATQRMTSSPYWRTYASTERLVGRMKVMVPRPKALLVLRTDIIRLVQLSSDDRLRDWASTLTDSYP